MQAKPVFDFVGRRWWYFLISVLILVPGLVSIAIPPPFKWGIEFTSGTAWTMRFEETDWTMRFEQATDQAKLAQALGAVGHADAIIEQQGAESENTFLVRTRDLQPAEKDETGNETKPAERETITGALTDSLGPFASVNFVVVSPAVDRPALAQALASLGHADAIIQRQGAEDQRTFLVRTRTLQTTQKNESGQVVAPAERETITNALEEKLGPFTTISFASVSPAVAQGIVSKVILALVLASVGILLYITYAFRRVPNPFRFGVAALIALVHDVALVMGVFSILGKVAGMEINAMFVTGLLTVAGYSVHDTIVVFDRIRENVRRTSFDLATTVNNSLLETLGRSLGTGVTTLFVLVAMLFIGGATIKSFLLVLVIGIISGTYSSIFIAAQVLVIWEKHEVRRLWGWLPMLRGATTR